MAPARKVYTEAMIRRVLKAHFEVEVDLTQSHIDSMTDCECGWSGTIFEDHFIDQLHKLWHEMFGRNSNPLDPTTTLLPSSADPHTIVTT